MREGNWKAECDEYALGYRPESGQNASCVDAVRVANWDRKSAAGWTPAETLRHEMSVDARLYP